MKLLPILCAAALSILPACSSTESDCADGVDNDGDGLIDLADPGCRANGDLESPDPAEPECNDNVDNDGDGLVDLDDPGCNGSDDLDERDEAIAQCRDGIDNDGDGLIDFPNDPGCGLSLEDDESDDCPTGPNCPQCANGQDDDGDGDADYPDDLGCNSAADDDEFNVDPTICGSGVPLVPLPPDGIAMGTAMAGGDNSLISASCGGNGPESAFLLSLASPAAVELSTDFAETTADTVIYVRTDCREPETEISCNDDAVETRAKLFIPRLEPGDYFLIVDSQATATGDFKLEVIAYIPEGEPCNALATGCAPGLMCNGATCEVSAAGPTCLENGTPRTIVSPTPGQLVISEYMANPAAVADASGEWFELRATTAVDLNGLEIGRAEPATGPGAVLGTVTSADCLGVTAGNQVLFARQTSAAVNGGLPSVDQTFNFDVVNSDDGLFISVGGSLVDQVTYSSTASGASSQREPSGSNFCVATASYGDGDLGTPRAANAACP